MCKRYSIYSTGDLQDRFGLEESPGGIEPVYNAAPLMYLPIITSEEPKKATIARWGLAPRWQEEDRPDSTIARVRAEEIGRDDYLSMLFRERRCIVPVNGFFEWRQSGEGRHPFFIKMKHREVYSLAGLWDIWNSNEGAEVFSYAIITTEANDLLRHIVGRMPAVLQREKEAEWLKAGPKDALMPVSSNMLEAYKVSGRVDNPSYNLRDAVEPVSEL